MSTSGAPFSTIWPSRYDTVINWPSIRVLTVIVFSGVTAPSPVTPTRLIA